MIIVVEAPDGAGKSTVSKLLVEKIKSLGWASRLCREPGGTRFGEAARPLLLDKGLALCSEAQTLLFTASRMQLLDEILPALATGRVLVFDRFDYSTIAYQVYAGCMPAHFVTMLNQQCRAKVALHRKTENLALHDIEGFHLVVSPEIAAQRLAQTGKTGDRFESQGDEYRAKLRQAYTDLEDPFCAAEFGVSNLTPIDASVSPAEVVDAIMAHVLPHLKAHPMQASG